MAEILPTPSVSGVKNWLLGGLATILVLMVISWILQKFLNIGVTTLIENPVAVFKTAMGKTD